MAVNRSVRQTIHFHQILLQYHFHYFLFLITFESLYIFPLTRLLCSFSQNIFLEAKDLYMNYVGFTLSKQIKEEYLCFFVGIPLIPIEPEGKPSLSILTGVVTILDTKISIM